MAVTYCTNQNILDFLQISAWGGTMTQAKAEAVINEVEDYIDSYTGTAWREKTVTNEYHDYPKGAWEWGTGVPIHLKYGPVKTFSALTDKFEVWEGSAWNEWLSTKTEGRGNDFWVNYEDATVYIVGILFLVKRALRFTYRYGYETVPNDIKEAAVLLTCARILSNESRSSLTPSGEVQFLQYGDRIKQWEDTAKEILDRHTLWRVGSFG